jgi:hypothetical protein
VELGAVLGSDLVADAAVLVRTQPKWRVGGVGDVSQLSVRLDGGEAIHRGGQNAVAEGHCGGDLPGGIDLTDHLRGGGIDSHQP